LSYLGNYGLPEVLTALAQSLDYFWMPTVFFDRANYNKHETGLWTQVRPLGLYYKPPKPRLYKPLVDVLLSPKKEKQFHPWQQSVPPALQLIEALTPGPGSWVLDPCAGAATTLLAAHQTGRNAIGFELDARTHAIAKKRLEAAGIEVRTQPDSVGRKSIGFGVSTGREKIPGCAAEKGS
jgi:DNA modification methylase